MSVVTQHARANSKTPLFPFSAVNPRAMVIRSYEDVFEECKSPAFNEETYTKTYAPLLGKRIYIPDTEKALVNKMDNKESIDQSILDLLSQLRKQLLEQYLFLVSPPKVIERFVCCLLFLMFLY